MIHVIIIMQTLSTNTHTQVDFDGHNYKLYTTPPIPPPLSSFDMFSYLYSFKPFSMAWLILKLLSCHRSHSIECMLAISLALSTTWWLVRHSAQGPILPNDIVITCITCISWNSSWLTVFNISLAKLCQQETDCLGVQWNITRSGRVGIIWRRQINFFPPRE